MIRWSLFRGSIGGSLAVAALAATASLAGAADNSSPGEITFTSDIAPIFHAKCVTCHRPNDIAPMALRTYDEVRPWAKSIRKAVVDRVMPPWHADPEFGHFSNDRSLSDKEIAAIDVWVQRGAPQGDPAQMPELEGSEREWRLGEPDMILTFDETELSAGGPDRFYDHLSKESLPEDKWVTAVEIKAGDPRVVHHVILWMQDENGRGGPGPAGWLAGWAAGMPPMEFPEGTGKLLKKGTRLISDMHYHPLEAEATTDRTKVGLHFADKPIEKEVVNLWVQNGGFKIPAGAANHEVRASHRFDQDSTILAFLPHMHYRGKDFTYTATFPDGRKQTLLHVPKWDFNWQTVYKLAEPIKAPKGTRIDCVAHFDNSADNPDNPDPTKDVTFGNESYDEMMIGFIDYVVDEGMRPMSAQETVLLRLEELAREHPGEVYRVEISQGSESATTAAYLPATGEGIWYLEMNGTAASIKVKSFKRLGPGFTAKLSFMGMPLSARGIANDAEGTITGKIYLPEQFGSPDLEFVGKLER